MNYNNDINQFNNGNDKIPDAGNNLLRNFYENNENNGNNQNGNNNLPNMDNINNNLLNIANNIDNLSLDGLNLSNYNNSDFKIKDKISENNTLIKTLTKEIINNIKDDDNLSSKISNKISNKTDKKKKQKEEEKIENFVVEDNNNSYLGNLINGENLKDFIIIFVLYFLLSQEMIKDFFGNYFTSLNPDDEGKVNVQGVIIYGLIFSFLFIIIKRLV